MQSRHRRQRDAQHQRRHRVRTNLRSHPARVRYGRCIREGGQVRGYYRVLERQRPPGDRFKEGVPGAGKSSGGCGSGHPRGNGPSRGDKPGGGVRLRRAQDRHGETPGGGSVPRRGAVRLRVQVRGCGVFMIVRCIRILMQASLY